MNKKPIGEVVEFGKKLVDSVKKKEEKDAVNNPDPREGMTPEQIQEYMKQEEEQLDGMLGKFLAANKPNPQEESVGQAEEEEEEIVTLDFDNNTATEKVGEGVAVRSEDGSVDLVKDPEVERKIKEAVEKHTETTKPTLQQKYQDMITDRIVSKAIASLVEKMSTAERETESLVSKTIGGAIGYSLSEKAGKEIYNQKHELRMAIAGGKVHYDKIPEWAKTYIDEYVYDAVGTLVDFVERD